MYDKRPATSFSGFLLDGWEETTIYLNKLMRDDRILMIDSYTGIDYEEVLSKIQSINYSLFVSTNDLMLPEQQVKNLTQQYMTDDVLFGVISNLNLLDFFDSEKLEKAKSEIINADGRVIVVGPGASLLSEEGRLVYADMPRWEIQMRMRAGKAKALGIDNRLDPFSLQYKRGYFNDWRVLDKHKKALYSRVDYWLDTTIAESPKLIDRETFMKGMTITSTKPFRIMPFFDPAPWGGQWMKNVMQLDTAKANYGWCFDCVPEENSLLFRVNGVEFEMPSVNLVNLKSKELLGEPVEARFGKDFPIRFDLLDTFDGGNLSFQVHPTTEFAKENFGIPYTQDESYYMIDAREDAYVYLGLKKGINKEEMIRDLEKTERFEDSSFDTDKYANKIPAKKHDHFLIPAGTVHCSGMNGLVLEISSTPNLFTFKMWDWNRLGLDGKPRPTNVQRGKQVIQWNRDIDYVNEQLYNRFEVISDNGECIEEKTGLHRNEFIETRRHTFNTTVTHHTNGSVNVLNLVDGEEIIVESPKNKFEPFTVHYAETFIVPECVKEYTIRPYGKSKGKECKTIKAYVRV